MYFVNAARNPGALAFPYVTPGDDGGLLHHPPEGYRLSAMAERFPVWRLVEDLGQRLAHDQSDTAQAVTLRLLWDMNAWCKERNIRFIALYPDFGDREFEAYAAYFKANGMELLDLRMPEGVYADWRLGFDKYGHLGEKAQTYWAGKVLSSGILEAR